VTAEYREDLFANANVNSDATRAAMGNELTAFSIACGRSGLRPRMMPSGFNLMPPEVTYLNSSSGGMLEGPWLSEFKLAAACLRAVVPSMLFRCRIEQICFRDHVRNWNSEANDFEGVCGQ